jgi:hypothetical protein
VKSTHHRPWILNNFFFLSRLFSRRSTPSQEIYHHFQDLEIGDVWHSQLVSRASNRTQTKAVTSILSILHYYYHQTTGTTTATRVGEMDGKHNLSRLLKKSNVLKMQLSWHTHIELYADKIHLITIFFHH